MSVGYQHMKKSKIRNKTCSLSWRGKWALDGDSTEVCVTVGFVLVEAFPAEVSLTKRPIIILSPGWRRGKRILHVIAWPSVGAEGESVVSYRVWRGAIANWLPMRIEGGVGGRVHRFHCDTTKNPSITFPQAFLQSIVPRCIVVQMLR